MVQAAVRNPLQGSTVPWKRRLYGAYHSTSLPCRMVPEAPGLSKVFTLDELSTDGRDLAGDRFFLNSPRFGEDKALFLISPKRRHSPCQRRQPQGSHLLTLLQRKGISRLRLVSDGDPYLSWPLPLGCCSEYTLRNVRFP